MDGNIARVVLGLFAVLMAVGGWMGARRAGSRVSLIAGSASGAACILFLLISFWLPKPAFFLATLLAFALSVLFLVRFRRTGNPMPSALLAVVSLVVATILLTAALQG